jgi:hypothetical protein
MSATQGGMTRPLRNAIVRASWAGWPRLGLGPEGEGGRGEEMGCRAESEEKGIFFFFFLFNYFKAFSNDFGIKFEFESNHSNQKFKCNSMSAQTYFYSYI